MLTKACFLPNLIELSTPASLLTSIGFVWDSNSHKFYPFGQKYEQFPSTGRDRAPRNKKSNVKVWIHLATTRLHLFCILLVILQTALSKETNVARKMISFFGLVILVFCTITVQVYHNNLHRCVSLINELVQMSTDLENGSSGGLDTKEKFIKLLAPALHWSAMVVPFAFVGGVVWVMPCMPSNLGYLLLPECSSSAAPLAYPLPKGLFLLANLWVWSYGVQCAVFVVIFVMLGAVSLRSFLKIYARFMFALPRTPKGSVRQLPMRHRALIYRRVHLLADRFNNIHKLKILVPLIFTVTSHQVFSAFGAIKFAGQLNLVSYALFAILGSQGFMVIMGMFTGLADVSTTSRRVLLKLQKEQRNHPWLRRFHASCQLIKIRFGALNYIDSFTPLAFENFALVQTTNMLMVE